MANISFDIVCGNCFRGIAIPSSDGGSLLSCGDFLCKDCASTKFSTVGCPVCGRSDVRAVFLNDSLPPEVKRNVNDVTKEFQSLYGTISFQIRHYKEIIRRQNTRIQQLQQECNNQKSQIKSLETVIQQKQVTPSFFSKDPDQRSDIFENHAGETDLFRGSRRESNNNPFVQPGISTTHREPPRPTGYYKQASYQEPRDFVAIPPLPPAMQKNPVRLYPESKPRDEPRSSSREVFAEPTEPENIRRRIYTPSRTVFSAQSNQAMQNSGGTPSRIRSPYNQIIRSPSTYAFIPADAVPAPRGNVYQTLSRSPKDPMQRRESQSPITSYIRQTYK